MSIQSEINRLAAAKEAIATAIAGKGVSVPTGTTLDGMAALIDSIRRGDPVTSVMVLEWELGVKLSKTDNSYTMVSYDPASTNNSYAASQHITIENGATYTLAYAHDTWNLIVSVCYFDATGGFVSYAANIFDTENISRDPVTFSPVSGAATMRLRVFSYLDNYGGDLATRLSHLSMTKTV